METRQETKHHIRLTSAEITNLWTTYIHNTLSKCVLLYFLSKVEDTEIRSVVEYALDVSKQIINEIENIFNEDNYPIPIGYTDSDVNVNAPRLYSDEFFVNYIDQMAKVGFIAYGLSTALSSRLDIQDFFNECVKANIEINKKSKAVLLSIQTNAIGKALITGFAQVADTKDARDYFKRGKEMANKHIKIFSSILTEEDIPEPRNWDDDVLVSTEAPFSDKLMMFHISLLSATGMGNYGQALATSTRRDLATHFSRLLAEVGQFAEDGANLQIKHGWMEEPPQSVNSNTLIK